MHARVCIVVSYNIVYYRGKQIFEKEKGEVMQHKASLGFKGGDRDKISLS